MTYVDISLCEFDEIPTVATLVATSVKFRLIISPWALFDARWRHEASIAPERLSELLSESARQAKRDRTGANVTYVKRMPRRESLPSEPVW
jgi:hypothetical protein